MSIAILKIQDKLPLLNKIIAKGDKLLYNKICEVKMAYLTLYRKFRPQNFNEVIGQDFIVKILVNQIKNNQIAHAYLFTGTRGTGKTSVAKIFAKAVNCADSQNFPCGKCESCLNTNSLDIIEMDAASNNGVDEIRELRDKVAFPPANSKYKVYIIDEVHMLSSSAFNALLKTLEEPPAHAIFILATTEVHKIPQTILSRCMRFDFKLVNNDVLFEHIKKIFASINVKAEDNAIKLIAQSGNGSVRDALSIAETCVSYCSGAISYADVLEVLGNSSPEFVLQICQSILQSDVKNLLVQVDDICNKGKSITLLAKDITLMMRNILFAKNCVNANKFLNLPRELFFKISEVANLNDSQKMVQTIEILTATETNLRYSAQPRIIIETALVKASNISASLNIDALILRIKDLENKVKFASASPVVMQTVSGETTQIAQSQEGISANHIWGYVIRVLREKNNYALYTLATTVAETTLKNNVLYVKVAKKGDYVVLNAIDNVKEVELILMQSYSNIQKVEYVCDDNEENINQDVSIIKSMFDNKIVSIKKTGGKN
ncbi:MAG: DNA polymerase III subunit gamma/tau [Clostridia bacterium]